MSSGLSQFLIALALLPAVNTLAGTNLSATYRVADLNAGSGGSFPSNMMVFGDSLYFSAYTLAMGRELWRYDGASITLATNINDTADDIGFGILEGNDSTPAWLTPFAGSLFFSAFDPRRGGELWRWNGTNAFRVADINPDANDTIKFMPNSSWPGELTAIGNTLYFSADDGLLRPNYELWRYHDSAATLAGNIHPDTGSNFGSYPKELTVFSNALYFMADDGTDGFELWKYDGTNATLFNLNPGNSSSGSYPKNFTPFVDHLYFQAYQDTTGFELWRADGAAALLVANLNAAGSSYPDSLTVLQNMLYFRADDGVHGSELWKFDGTNATLVTNLNASGDSFPKNLTVFQDKLCFAANDGANGWELWKYDDTAATLVTNLNTSGDSFPEALTVFNGALYFVATTPATGYELWKYDGQIVSLVSDINPGSGNSYPQFLHAFGNQLVFSATEDGSSNWELWSHAIGPLHVESVKLLGTNIDITWATLGGTTNVVQAALQVNGTYSDISQPIIVQGNGISRTNFIHAIEGVLTARFYRVVQR